MRKGFIWNASNCEFECDKSCNISEYLDYSNCKCRKKLVDKIIEEFNENVENILGKNENKDKYRSCTLYIVLFWIFFIFSVINIVIGIYFTYYKYMSLNK